MDHFTGTLTQMNFPTKMTLAVGYALAVPPLLAIVPVFRNPVGRTRFLNIPHRVVLLSPLLGAACVSAGWFATGARAQNAANIVWVITCTTIRLRSENKRRLQRRKSETA